MNSPYHDWLIRRRIWCQHPNCFDKLTRAVVVRNVNGKDQVFCSFHGRSLSAIRANLARKTPTTQTELQPTRQ